MKKIITLIILISSAVLSGCGQGQGTDESGRFKNFAPMDFPQLDEKITFEILTRTVLEPSRCTECHKWALREARFNARIIPMNAEASEVFQSVTTGTMPKDMPRLSTLQLDILRRFIEGK